MKMFCIYVIPLDNKISQYSPISICHKYHYHLSPKSRGEAPKLPAGPRIVRPDRAVKF